MSVLLVVALLVVVAGVAGFGVALARSGRKQYAEQGQIVPGVASEAPAEWAGAHTPEAKLHRRLGAAIKSLHALAGSPGESVRLLELRVELEQQALDVDRRLIAAAAVPGAGRGPALAKVEEAVVAVEKAAGELAGQIAGASGASLDEVVTQISLAAQARQELDDLERLGPPVFEEFDEDDTPQPGTA